MRIDDLRQIELFRDLDDQALARLAQEFVEIHVPAEYPLFREGSTVDAFYVVKQGRVVVYRDTAGTPVQLLARVGAYEFFGEFGLFTHAESTISARTTEASCLLKVGKQSLLDFLADQPVITLKLQMAAAKRHTINAAAALELGQRSEVRIRVRRGVVLALEDGSSRPAMLDNLCSGGMSLRGAPADWREGDFVRFELRLASDSLPCEGRVAWVEGELVGLAFTDTSEDHDTQVQQSLCELLGPRRRAVS